MTLTPRFGGVSCCHRAATENSDNQETILARENLPVALELMFGD